MDAVLKALVYIHIRLSKRKIYKFDMRIIISTILVVPLIGLLFVIANPYQQFQWFIFAVLGILADLGLIYIWFTAGTYAQTFLKDAKEGEIINTKYKLKEF